MGNRAYNLHASHNCFFGFGPTLYKRNEKNLHQLANAQLAPWYLSAVWRRDRLNTACRAFPIPVFNKKTGQLNFQESKHQVGWLWSKVNFDWKDCMSPKNKSELFSDITSCQLRIYERGPTSQEMLWAIKIASHCHLGIYDLSHWSCHAHSHPSSVQTICRNAIRTEHLSSNISNKAFWEPFCSTKITRKMSVLLGEYLSSSSLFPQHSPKCPICNPYAVGIHAGTKNQGPPSRFYQAFWSNKVSSIWWSASKADGLDHHQLQEFKTWSQRAAKKKNVNLRLVLVG